MKQDFEIRSAALFEEANRQLKYEIEKMLAEHSAKGMLRSGNTAIKSVGLFESLTRDALMTVLQEQGKLLTHRGKAWRVAGQGISRSLDTQIEKAPQLIAPACKVAGASLDTAAGKATLGKVSETAHRLRGLLNEFQDGWSAPRPEKWTERHPIAYAIGLLLAGLVLGKFADLVLRL